VRDTKSLLYPQKAERVNERMSRTLFIDPGIEGTGYALFDYYYTKAEKAMPPIKTGSFRPRNKDNEHWQRNCEELWSWFGGMLTAMQPSIIVLESQGVWSESAKSMASATRGDIMKLTYLTGGMAHCCFKELLETPVLVAPRVWKGQLPKKVVISRLNKHFPTLSFKNHEADAVGMGVAAQGLL